MQKVWVFQSKKAFLADEIQYINEKLQSFVSQWKAHGSDLSAKFCIEENQFIIVKVDEDIEKASGCSIDSLTRVIKEIDAQFNLSLLNRNLVSFINDNSIQTEPLNEFKKYIRLGKILPETLFYNLAISTSEEFETQFKIQVKNSWAKNLLPES